MRFANMWIKKFIAVGLAALPLALWAATTQAASLDCAKANTAIKKMICADAELSKLDKEVEPLYQQANERTADPVEFKAGQRQWLKSRNSCKDAACLSQAYHARLAALQALLQAPKPCFRLLERRWPEVASGHYPVCVDVLKSMNTLCANLPLCEWKVSSTVPSLSLPQWEELDPKKYLKLIQHMYQTPRTFNAPEEQWTPIPSDVLSNIQEGKARLWHTWLDADRDGEKENVVRFHPYPCENKIDFYVIGSGINVADASMNRVDPRFAGWDTAAMDILFYNGQTFIIGRGDDLEFSVEEPFFTATGKGKSSVCVFQYLKP